MSNCEHNLEFDEEETAGLQWLNRVLMAIHEKGADHKSFVLAREAWRRWPCSRPW